MKKISILLPLFLGVLSVLAQPANDACPNAILISNVSNYCSAPAAGTTVNSTDDVATSGGYSAATCWGGTVNDVWYKFVATASDITIIVNGNQGSPVGGTLTRPQVALYSGVCGGTLSELVCGSAPSGQNIIQIYKAGLTIGQTYLIRVDGVNANTGTFQICVNNFNPVPLPMSDCNTAVVLCDKSGFTVPGVTGAGSNSSEMNGAACLGYDPIFNPFNVETNSAWYVFTFKTAGTFTFVLSPSNPDDDLDFVVYKLPSGIGNCTGKTVQRCEASQCPLIGWTTGLNTTSTDVSEDGGCDLGQDNFLKQLTVAAGETYALGINNFTSTGNGFNISFGGTAEIQGPTAVINDNDADDIICVAEAITFSDASTPPPSGSITNWTWNFGLGATPATFNGQNPPAVTYSSNGTKTISLMVRSDRGCLITTTKTITVTTQPPTVSIVGAPNNICPGTPVTFTATPTNGGTAPTYQWYLNNSPLASPTGPTYTSSTLNNNDQVKVQITSNSPCAIPNTSMSNIVTMVVTTPSPVDVTITGNTPVCPGAPLTLTANPTNGGATPVYQWYLNGNPVGGNSNTYSSSSFNNGDVVTVKLTSSLGCVSNNPKTSNPVTVTIKPNPTVTVNSPTICNNQTATLTANGATTYSWTGGLSGNPATTPALSSTTTYTVTGTLNGCTGTAVATVTVAPSLSVTVNSPSICSGQTATLTANGATSYTWTGGLSGNPATTPALNTTTTYTVTGTTSGCTGTAVATVTVKPNPTVTVNSPSICDGQTTTLTANGATTYTWTGGLSGNPVTTPVLNTTTTYTVTGTTNGCTGTAVATVTIKPNPTVTVNSPGICDGQTAILTANGATTYSWTGGLSGNPATTPVLNTTTTYTVTGTTNGCTGTAAATVTVKPNPSVTVNNPSICSGQTSTLTANGAATYSWTGGLSGNPATTPALNTTTTYTVTGTTNGCTGTAVSTVTVKPNPTVTVNNPSICDGQTATLTANGATTYSWTGGLSGNPATTPALNTTTTYTVTGTTNGCTGTAAATVTVKPNPIVTVNSPGICDGQTAALTANGATTYTWTSGLSGNPATTPTLNSTTTYTITGTTNGCTGTAVATVFVTPNPVVTVNSPSICNGQTAVLTANGATTYTWTSGLGSGASVTTPSLTGTRTYTVTGTTNGCTGTAVATVTVKPNPTVTVNSPTICNNQSATLTANGATSYTWSGGLSGNPATTPLLTSTQTYTVTGTTNGCTGTAVSTVSVSTNLLITVNNPSICDGQTATLTATGGTTYTWTGGLGSGASVTTPSLSSTQTYTVTGTTSGCTGSATATVTVIPNPTITVNSPAICSGQTATLTANGATTYTWTGGLNGNPTTTPALNTTTTYTVTGTTSGCTGTAVATVTVKPNPVVTVNNPTICSGLTAILNPNGATTYTWTGGLNGNPATTPVLNSTQTYTVTGTTNGCTGTATATVNVTPNPTVTVNSPSVCNGQTATITAVGANTYVWSGGLGSGSTVTTPVLTTNQTYTVTGTANGCTGTATSNVSVKPNPTVTANNPSICSGQTANLTANGATTYSWTGGLGSGPNVTTPVLAATQTYTVTGTTNGCTGTANSTVLVKPTKSSTVNKSICSDDSVQIGTQTFNQTGNFTVVLQTSQGCDSTVRLNLTVTNVLTPSVTITASKTDLCPGDVVTFKATPVDAGSNPTYQWLLNSNPVGTNSSQFIVPNLNDNDEVKVIVTSNAACASPKTATSNSVIVNLSKVTYTKPVVSYCQKDSQTIDLLVNASPDPDFTVKWTNGSTVITNANSSFTFNNLSNANVPFEITYGNNCKANDMLKVTVHPLPVINATSDIADAKYEQEVQLNANSSTSLTFNWIPSDQVSNDSIQNPTTIIKATTLYNVTVRDTNNCVNSDTVLVRLIDECMEDFIYMPNAFSPNRDGVNDCFGIMSPPKLTNFKMTIFNRWGEKVFEASDENDCWDGLYKGTSALSDAYVYVVSFTCYNGKLLTKKGTVTIIK